MMRSQMIRCCLLKLCDNYTCCSVNTVTHSFCVILDVQAACPDATVTQELLKDGFHRYGVTPVLHHNNVPGNFMCGKASLLIPAQFYHLTEL